MKPQMRRWAFGLLAAYAIGLTGYEVTQVSQERETVLEVQGREVTRAEAEGRILQLFWSDSLDLLADELVLAEAANQLGLAEPTEAELQAEAKAIQTTENRMVEIEKDSLLLKERIVIKKLARTHTVSDDFLRKLPDVNQPSNSSVTAIHGMLLEGAHEKLVQADELLKKQVAPEEVAKQLGLKVTTAHVTAENEFQLSIAEVQAGDVRHVHAGDRHALLLAQHLMREESKEAGTDSLDVRFEAYMNANLAVEKANLVQVLRGKYSVQKTL